MERNDPNTQGPAERRIVVGTDGSACATRAVAFAVPEAARWGALLQVVTAYQEMPAEGGVVVPLGIFQGSAEAIVSNALRQAEELEPTAVLKGETVFGAPGPALLARSEGAAELVVGTRGHGELTGLLFGSVSEYVPHRATCTTTVVR